MEQEQDTSTPQEEQIIWPKGRQIKKLIPKFGSIRNPLTIPGTILRKNYDDYQHE